jgi:division protein CdvB (Snf7/Vps24/ESCRT-III family)
MIPKTLEGNDCGLVSQVEIVAEEGSMEMQNSGDALADLTEAVAIQDELVQQRLAIEWVKTILDRLVKNWMQLETHEAIAYEDKVQSQVNLLTEATGSLTHLHKTLGRFSHQLKTHRRHLGQANGQLGL